MNKAWIFSQFRILILGLFALLLPANLLSFEPLFSPVFSFEPICQITEGVYTAQCRLPTGETVYFGMENVMDSEEKWHKWYTFKERTHHMVNSNRGLISCASRCLKKPEHIQKAVESGKYGTEEEFARFLEQLKEREIYPDGKRFEALVGISAGVAGLCSPDFMAYISKKPVTGYITLPNDPPVKGDTIAFYRQDYDDLLMVIGVSFNKSYPQIFINRGIFQNPFRLINGECPNIATRLHCFTGKVVRDFLNDELDTCKMYMTVAPIPEMFDIMIKAFPRGQLKIKDEIPEELHVPAEGVCDTEILVTLEDLSNLH